MDLRAQTLVLSSVLGLLPVDHLDQGSETPEDIRDVEYWTELLGVETKMGAEYALLTWDSRYLLAVYANTGLIESIVTNACRKDPCGTSPPVFVVDLYGYREAARTDPDFAETDLWDLPPWELTAEPLTTFVEGFSEIQDPEFQEKVAAWMNSPPSGPRPVRVAFSVSPWKMHLGWISLELENLDVGRQEVISQVVRDTFINFPTRYTHMTTLRWDSPEMEEDEK